MVGQQATGQLGVVHPEVAEPGLAPGAPVGVRQGPRSQPVDEASELAGGDRLAAEVDELDRQAALAEEPLGGPRRLRVLGAEDLDERSGRR